MNTTCIATHFQASWGGRDRKRGRVTESMIEGVTHSDRERVRERVIEGVTGSGVQFKETEAVNERENEDRMGANATEQEEDIPLRDRKGVTGRDKETERVIEWQRGTHTE